MADNAGLVTYCGMCCGDCPAHASKVADMARDLRKELRAAKFQRHAESLAAVPLFAPFKHYGECYEVLGAMAKFGCAKACRGGGGPPFCNMRKCCQRKGIEGCWQCDEFETCEKLDFLKPAHGEAHLKNLRTLKRKGVDAFLTGKRYWWNEAKTST